MTAQEIIQLLNGGFTHDEIIALTQATTAAATVTVSDPAPVQEPTTAQADEPSEVSAADPSPEPVQDPAGKSDQIQALLTAQADLQKQVAKLTSTLQAQAIANSVLPGGITQHPDASQILGQVIRPTRSKKEE
ncbi:MAG: hypothetical protein J6V25_10445 [Oscillospiraceae bacterium]|nr:hypothetical protein [Oscillospiraceae bacterium]